MSLRKHLETIVRPWLLANARWVFQNRQLLIGTCEELTDRQAQWELIDITERALGGYWEPPMSSWESRRESMLDLLGKSAPFAFQPALQISPDARLLIEALSGRWSYEKDRSDQRNIWWQIANAFSLVVARATQVAAAAAFKEPEVETRFNALTIHSPHSHSDR